MMYVQLLFGISAGFITFCGEIWYNFSILTGRTRPDRAAWWVLSLSWILLGLSHYAVGGVATILVPLVFTVSVLITAILASMHGVDFDFGPFEKTMLAIVAASFGLWWCFDAPLIALLANIGINASGTIMIIRKTYLHPGSEAFGPWILTILGDTINMFAIGRVSNEWILPTYLLLSNGCMLLVMMIGSIRVISINAKAMTVVRLGMGWTSIYRLLGVSDRQA